MLWRSAGWSLTLDAARGRRKDPPWRGRRGVLSRATGRSGCFEGGTEGISSLSGPETADSQTLVSARGPFRAHLSQKAPPRCGQRGQRPPFVTYLMRNDWLPLLALPWLEPLA